MPGVRRSPGGGNGNPFQYPCLENPVDRGAWWAIVCGVTKSRTWLSRHEHAQETLNSESWDSAYRKCPCPLQYSRFPRCPWSEACGAELPRSFLLPGSPPRLQANSAGSLPLGSNEWLVHFLYPAGCWGGGGPTRMFEAKILTSGSSWPREERVTEKEKSLKAQKEMSQGRNYTLSNTYWVLS